MFSEWDKIERELRDESNTPERTVFTVWMYIGVMAFVTAVVVSVLGGQ